MYSDKIYRIDIDDFDKIGIRMPDGISEGTVSELWKPFGYLRPFKDLSTGETIFARETVFYKLDGTRFVHNNNWDEFVRIFEEVGTVKQIYP